ncbi:MAG TPA: TIGR00341 family protein [Caldilineae bacterium]|nr:TIGR00341 family protein [Caldilineae bacterium]
MNTESTPRATAAVRYSRVLTLPRVVGLGLTVGVGVGIFTLSELLLKMGGAVASRSSYLLLFLIALPFILTYAERAGVVPGRAGSYSLARYSGQLEFTFLTGWMQLAGYGVLFALLAAGVALQVSILAHVFFGVTLSLKLASISVLAVMGLNTLLASGVKWRSRSIYVFLGIAALVFLLLRDFFVVEGPVFWNLALNDRKNISLMPVLLSTLWALEFIVSSRDEIVRPTRNVFPGMVLTMVIVAALGIISSSLIQSGAELQDVPQAPLLLVSAGDGHALQGLFLITYTVAGLGLNLLALSYGLIQVISLFEAMRRDGFLPEHLATKGLFSRVPLAQITIPMLVAAAVIVLGDIRLAAGLAALAFLWIAAFTHLPDAFRAKSGLSKNRRPKLPFHPLFPWIVVALGLFLPLAMGHHYWLWGVGWILAGIIYYVLYARSCAIKVRHKEAVVSDRDEELELEAEYRVLVAIADPGKAIELIQAAAKLASSQDGRVLALKVLTLPEQMPGHLKQEAAAREMAALRQWVAAAQIPGVPVQGMVRIAPSVPEGLLEAVREEHIDLLLLGWGGDEPPDEGHPHPIFSPILRYAECDVVLLRGQMPQRVEKILIPTAGGPHAPFALEVAHKLRGEQNAELVVLSVMTDAPTEEERQDAEEAIATTVGALADAGGVSTKIELAKTVEAGIRREAEHADLLFLGASQEGFLNRPYFGGISTVIGYASAMPLVLAKKYRFPEHPTLERLWSMLTDPLPHLTVDRIQVVSREILGSAVATVDFYVLIVLASIIASLGLLQNSAAVIIGAMLVAPLMSPILAMAMAMVIGDYRQLLEAAESTAKGVTLAIIVGMAVTLLSPLNQVTDQILARTEPTVLDLGVALASGAAAGYAMSRKEVSAALPGVAIAAALVPPLCVTGYGLGVFQLRIASGSLLLFATNLVAIIFAAAITFLALGFHPERSDKAELQKGMQITLVSLAGILVILLLTTAVSVRKINVQTQIERLFSESYITRVGATENIQMKSQGDINRLTARIYDYEGRKLSPEDVTKLRDGLQDIVGGEVWIDAEVIDTKLWDTKLDDMVVHNHLEDQFTELATANGATVVEIGAKTFREGYAIDAIVVTFGRDTLTEAELSTIQEQLENEVGAPVRLQVAGLTGQMTLLEQDATPTPEPQ